MDPLRLGIVDMGSNAIRLMVAEVGGGRVAVLENHRLALRLGRDVFATGQVPEATIAAVVDAFRRFRATCDRLAATRVRAIATSALREARNRDVLVDRVRDASGIEIEVVSGTQEAFLLAHAVQTKVDLSRGRSVLVDVGGGSVEVVVVENGSVVAADSYRLGALRMLAMLPDQTATGAQFVDLLQRHLHGLEWRIGDHFAPGRVDRYVAVGGNIESLTDLLRGSAAGDGDGVESVEVAAVRREVQALAALDNDARMSQRGLKPDRADTIVPAGVVYVRIGEIAGCDRVLVPRVGIKDGLLAEARAGHVASFSPEEHVDAVLGACRALGRRFGYESAHAEAVAALARQIFDQTRSLHGLDDRARVLLEAASLLHDVGVCVNNDGHHKHSQYLIAASEIVGLADDQKALVAMLARYHRRAVPARDHEDFARLSRKERSLVERLAAILRVADALDRQHAGLIQSVQVHVGEGEVALRPTIAQGQSSSLSLERQALGEKGELFAQVFGRKVALLA